MYTYVEIPSLYDSSLIKSLKKEKPANLEQEICSDFKFSSFSFLEGLVKKLWAVFYLGEDSLLLIFPALVRQLLGGPHHM